MIPVVLSAATPTSPETPPRVLNDHIVIAYDCEWDPHAAGKPLLSIQFAYLAKDQQGNDKTISAVYDPPGPRINYKQLVQFVVRFIRENKIPAKPSATGRVYVDLIAHFAQAEISMIENHFRDVAIVPVGGKAHMAGLPSVRVGKKTFCVKIIDLYAFFKTGLEEVGEYVGLRKLDDGVDRSRLAELKIRDPAKYDAYARRDVEIPIKAYWEFREQILRAFGIDVLTKRTLPSVAGEIFRRRFLTVMPVRSRIAKQRHFRPRKDGVVESVEERLVYDGEGASREERRIFACKCNHGALAEAYVHGFWNGPVDEWDVTSCYPLAAMLQPLPNANTKWFVRTNPGLALADVEGFGFAEFTFPPETQYPCLVTHRRGYERMAFVLQGETYCTVAELRMAQKLGAVFKKVRLHVFKPTDGERNHDVGRYMQHFFALKKDLAKETLEYEVVKLLMNGLIGKFAERPHPDRLIQEERRVLREGWPGVARVVASSPFLQGIYRGQLRTGSLFVPEWSTLILGRARELMADFIQRGALLVSTDSVLVPSGTSIECRSRDLLRSVGGDMAKKRTVDAVIIIRTRLYAMLMRPENWEKLPVEERGEVVARDDNWVVVKIARHGVAVDKPDCGRAFLSSLQHKCATAVGAQKKTLLGAGAAIRAGTEINFERVVGHEPKFAWDGKRALVNGAVNPWASYSETKPYQSLPRLADADLRKLEARERRRDERRKNAKEKHDLLVSLLGERCHSCREISRRTGLSKSSVQRMSAAMGWAQMERYRNRHHIVSPSSENDDGVSEVYPGVAAMWAEKRKAGGSGPGGER
jgi:hypothetical protein